MATLLEQRTESDAGDSQNAETWWRQNVRPVLQAVGSYSKGQHGYIVDPDRIDEIARGEIVRNK